MSDVIAWDWRTVPMDPADESTWVPTHSMTLCGGTPFVVVNHATGVYRNDEKGRAWKCVAAKLYVQEEAT